MTDDWGYPNRLGELIYVSFSYDRFTFISVAGWKRAGIRTMLIHRNETRFNDYGNFLSEREQGMGSQQEVMQRRGIQKILETSINIRYIATSFEEHIIGMQRYPGK